MIIIKDLSKIKRYDRVSICGSKKRYDLLDGAFEPANKYYKENNMMIDLVIYRCPACGYWHYGHQNKNENKNIIPSSKELILLATNDFKNREERKGLHDQSSWVSGWITGFLSERKPNWSKVLEEKVRKDTLESFSGFIDAYRREDEDGHDYVSVLALQKHIDWLMETE